MSEMTDILYMIFWNKFSCLNFEYHLTVTCARGLLDYVSSLSQVMAWRRTCHKPLTEPMLVMFNEDACCPQAWVNNEMTRYPNANIVESRLKEISLAYSSYDHIYLISQSSLMGVLASLYKLRGGAWQIFAIQLFRSQHAGIYDFFSSSIQFRQNLRYILQLSSYVGPTLLGPNGRIPALYH